MAKKHARRLNGEGSVFQRKDGLWCACVTIGYDDNGYQKKKYIYAKTRAEVTAKLNEFEIKINNKIKFEFENKKLSELMQDWLLTFKKNSVTSRTFEGIFRNYKLHIEPLIGDMKLQDLNFIVVQKIINNMIENDYCLATAKKVKFIINQFCSYAIDCNWILTNPTTKVKVRSKDKNKSSKEKYKALPPDERNRFINALNKDPSNFLKPLCYVMMFAGLRCGEAIALIWRNVDFSKKTIKVEQSITQETKFDKDGKIIDRQTIVGNTKTTCSVREIPATDIVLEELKKWKEQQREKSANIGIRLTAQDDYVFCNDDGTVRTYSGCRMTFDRFIKRNNLLDLNIHFHGLRHTFSNMLFEINENPKVIQQLLGHRDVKTTIMVYNNVNNEYIRESTMRLNEVINQNEMLRKKELETAVKEKQTTKKLGELSKEELASLFEKFFKEQTEKQV